MFRVEQMNLFVVDIGQATKFLTIKLIAFSQGINASLTFFSTYSANHRIFAFFKLL